MPAKPTWFLELPRIREELEQLKLPVVDRACFERLFGVRRMRAIQLMRRFGGYQAGKTLLVDRKVLIKELHRLTSSSEYEWESARRTRLVAEIDKMRKLAPGRQVKVEVRTDVVEHQLADVPAGIHLKPGELRIEFTGAEELLRLLFELSQAIMNDYKKFTEICKSESSNV